MNLTVEEISREVVDCAFHIHHKLGPGLLENVYEKVMERSIHAKGLSVERHKPIAFEFEGAHFHDGLRVDLLVEGRLVIELKSVEKLLPVHPKQLLTYLRLMKLPLGLLINFGAADFSDVVKRVVNGHTDLSGSTLRVNRVALESARPEA